MQALQVREVAAVLAVLVGVILLAIIGEVPCLGWLISLLVGTVGVGAVILSRFGTRLYGQGGGSGMVPAYAGGPLPPAPYNPAGPVQPAPYENPGLNPPGIPPAEPTTGELGAGK